MGQEDCCRDSIFIIDVIRVNGITDCFLISEGKIFNLCNPFKSCENFLEIYAVVATNLS